MAMHKRGFARLRPEFTEAEEEKHRMRRYRARVKESPGEKETASQAYHMEAEGAKKYPPVASQEPEEEDNTLERIRKRRELERRLGAR